MIQVHPVVEVSPSVRRLWPPVVPARCRVHAVPVARLEWRVGDRLPYSAQDAAELVERFLAAHGLALGDLSVPRRFERAHAVCGAALFLSSAAGAGLVGGPAGRPTPAPEVPDLAITVYAHRGSLITESRESAPMGGLPTAGHYRLSDWVGSWTEQDHAHAVARVRDAISAGDVYQVNVVGHSSAAYAGDPLPALARLASVRGAHYAGLMTGPGWAIACASPETLVSVRDGVALTRPIKGTAPATTAGRIALLTSEKERAEHIMIVDLERNDLAQVAEIGSVTVPDLFVLRHWGDLWQAESTVRARLRAGTGLADLLRAVCPGGSVTGAPKIAALHQIAALEPVGRGPSMGALGWVGPDHIDLGLTIRTVAATPTHLHLWAGGGITWGSDPAAEVAEAAAKAAPLRALLH
jgi:para-aminobenzoate synthetase component 1